jgi:hypothetical protein
MDEAVISNIKCRELDTFVYRLLRAYKAPVRVQFVRSGYNTWRAFVTVNWESFAREYNNDMHGDGSRSGPNKKKTVGCNIRVSSASAPKLNEAVQRAGDKISFLDVARNGMDGVKKVHNSWT